MSRVLTFKLGANKQLPKVDWKPRVVFNPPAQTGDAATIREGYGLFQDLCMGCHGLNAVSGLLIPDLRGSAYLHDASGWNSVVREGALSENGMPSVVQWLNLEQSEAVRSYIIQQAHRGQALQ